MFGSLEPIIVFALVIVIVIGAGITYFVVKWAVRDAIKESGLLNAIDRLYEGVTGFGRETDEQSEE